MTIYTTPRFFVSKLQRLVFVLLLGLATAGYSAIPTPDKLLPDDTLIVVTAPDFSKLRDAWSKAPGSQLWNDPSMKPFKERLLTKWNEEVLQPVERDLGIKFDDYLTLLQGQVTLALIQNGWHGEDEPAPGVVLLVDARDKKEQLKQNLASIRKKWMDSGKPLRTEKVHEVEFGIFGVSSNDIPKSLGKLMPQQSSEVEEAGDDAQPKKAPSKTEWVVGQMDSLLIAGSSVKAVEKIVVRLSGGSIPALGESAAYQADHLAMFRDSPLYAWINAKAFLDILVQKASEKKENADAPNPFDVRPEKIVGALGLSSLKTVAFSFQFSDQGQLVSASLGVPEANRQGLFKILAGEPKESTPPAFVPADAIKFQRWRIDGQKTWAALEHMAGDISPQWLSGINFLLETANTAAKEKDPGFDVKKNLIGNLGDDIISYDKAPRGTSLNELVSPPSILLIGSPKPEDLAIALKSLLVLVGQQTGTPPEEREFLGRKIYSIQMRSLGLPMGGAAASGAGVTLRYAASGGYLALSTDVSILEEYLRSSESQGKRLKDAPGLREAAQRVIGPGTSLFGFENQAESIRSWFELLRKDSDSTTNSPISALLSAANPHLKEWFDFSLLPSYDKVSKYFYLSVYGGGATVDGLNLKLFSPVPPASRSAESSKP